MDDYDCLGLGGVDFVPGESAGERLALLSLDEAHDLPRLLQTVAQAEGPVWPEAGRLAWEIAARIRSEG